MHLHSLNLLAIFVAGLSTMAVGFLWYSPLLFAKPWMRENRRSCASLRNPSKSVCWLASTSGWDSWPRCN